MSTLDVFALGVVFGFVLASVTIRLAVRWGALHTRNNCPAAKEIP